MNELVPVVRQIVGAFEDLAIPYAIGGSFASGAWGRPRQTLDIDLSVHMQATDVEPLLARVRSTFMVSDSEALEATSSHDEYRSFQMLHFETTFKADVFVRHREPYDYAVLERAVRIEILLGLSALCLTAEDIIIQKLRWFELGNRVSDRQWNDIVQVLEVQDGALDMDYLRKWADFFDVLQLLEEAIDSSRSS